MTLFRDVETCSAARIVDGIDGDVPTGTAQLTCAVLERGFQSDGAKFAVLTETEFYGRTIGGDARAVSLGGSALTLEGTTGRVTGAVSGGTDSTVTVNGTFTTANTFNVDTFSVGAEGRLGAAERGE